MYVYLNEPIFSFIRGAREAKEASTKQSRSELWSQLTHWRQLAALIWSSVEQRPPLAVQVGDVHLFLL